MATFIYIVSHIVLPVFVLVAIGITAQRTLKMDVRTFSRINIYIMVPAVLFMKIYEAKVSFGFVSQIFLYVVIIEALMYVSGQLISRLLKYSQNTKIAFCNSLLFFNSGNYGLPLVELVFKGDPVATTCQIFIMLIQNVTTNTFGVFQASTGNSSYKQALRNVLSMPTIYVLAAVIIVKLTGFTVPEQITVPLQYLSNGFVGFALITLGVQLAEVRANFKINDALISSFIRLIASPALGFLLVMLLGVKGILAKSLIIGVATPTAVNTAILAREFDNEPEYSSQMVLISTVLSPVTISVIIYLMNSWG